MDFAKTVVIDTHALDWVASPMAGVWRKPLAREDAERGHATSLVRFEPGAHFPLHDHPLGEEILVLEGIFSDEFGDYPAGTYFRNPPGFKHRSFSEKGCLILVKLHQFQNGDNQQINIDTDSSEWLPGQGNLKVMPLHSYRGENTALVNWPAGEVFVPHQHWGGEEIFVIKGEFIDEYGAYPAGTWIRSPHMSKHHPRVEIDTTIWVKVGHLPDHAPDASQT